MASRAEPFAHFTLSTPLRWLGAAAAVAAAAAVVANLRARARQPRIAPMSHEWLQSHAADREYQSYE